MFIILLGERIDYSRLEIVHGLLYLYPREGNNCLSCGRRDELYLESSFQDGRYEELVVLDVSISSRSTPSEEPVEGTYRWNEDTGVVEDSTRDEDVEGSERIMWWND